MQITVNNITYPDYSFEVIETNFDTAIINIDPENDYEVPIDVDYEQIPVTEGDRVTGHYTHIWSAETMSNNDLRKEIIKNLNYRKAI